MNFIRLAQPTHDKRLPRGCRTLGALWYYPCRSPHPTVPPKADAGRMSPEVYRIQKTSPGYPPLIGRFGVETTARAKGPGMPAVADGVRSRVCYRVPKSQTGWRLEERV